MKEPKFEVVGVLVNSTSKSQDVVAKETYYYQQVKHLRPISKGEEYAK